MARGLYDEDPLDLVDTPYPDIAPSTKGDAYAAQQPSATSQTPASTSTTTPVATTIPATPVATTTSTTTPEPTDSNRLVNIDQVEGLNIKHVFL